MSINLLNFAIAAEPGIEEVVATYDREQEDFRREFFRIIGSNELTYTTQQRGRLGRLRSWKGNNNQMPMDQTSLSFSKTLKQEKFALGVEITEEFVTFNKYPQLREEAESLADARYHTYQEDALSPFNLAFEGGRLDDDKPDMIGPDGLPLCHDAHPIHKDFPNNTYSNLFRLVLNHGNLSKVRVAMMTRRDERDKPISVQPDTLLVPIDLQEEAQVITGSAQQSGTTDNNINFFKSLGYRVVPCRFLTHPKRWFLLDSKLMKRHLRWITAKEPSLDRSGDWQPHTHVLSWLMYGWWTYGWDNPIWIAGSDPEAA